MTAKQEITDLTICRAALAAWVFIYHVDLYLNFSAWLGPLSGLIRRGYLGVDGFFILSGMILARVHMELIAHPFKEGNPRFNPPSWDKIFVFWARRLARIYPVHLATLAILVGLVLLGHSLGWAPRDPERFGIVSLVENLLLVHGWGFTSHWTWDYPSWSVSVEWAGYLLFPIIWYLIAYYTDLLAGQFLIVMFFVGGTVIHFSSGTLNVGPSEELLRFFPSFIAGTCLARTVMTCADYENMRQLIRTIGIVLFSVFVVIGSDLMIVTGIAMIMFAFLMQVDAGLPALLPKMRAPLWLGRISYSFYMSFGVAELVISQAFRRAGWTPGDHGWLFALGMLVLTVGLAQILYTVVETPCRRWANAWLDVRAT
jgi:peptidoglycan/LPS O-acetylase OafA/YrhL